MQTVPPPLPPTPPPLPGEARALDTHPCPECGGNMEWDAGKQALACPYCGTVSTWQPGQGQEEAILELDLEQALRDPSASRDWGSGRREVQCQNCHAISVFIDGRVAQRCEFCGSPAILPHEALQDAIVPQSLLPFKISQTQVRQQLRQWYGSRWFAPNRLKNAALTDTVHGIYLPYWTFDAHADASWRAEAGYYYYTDESYRDAQGHSRTRRVRHVRWEPASGHVSHFFDDELVPGTVGVHAPLLRAIEPFPTRDALQPYRPEFVRGWTVERYQVDLRRAAAQSRSQMEQALLRICRGKVPGNTQRNLSVSAHYHGRTFKHVLVPVWLVSYTYGSKTYQVLANGHSGKIAGERPYSWVKIALAVLAAISLLALFLLLFG